MKTVLLVASFLILSVAFTNAVDDEADCKCWKDFVPELHIDHYHCRGLKHKRLFDCNEPEPPLCKCTVDGKQTVLDLGEVHCAGIRGAGKDCDNVAEFEELFKKHPQLRLHH
ncbi:uncharacterized protein LOC123685080 [Harmonia axyridis]|uniref:uncharacterized protein LOC123685080 n=1 Tax=Harmonia axyridis TaxID=115357 RepID=UPI001E276455|nr:uncharacterized protein LOC123685080 [Harmonia axyridis]